MIIRALLSKLFGAAALVAVVGAAPSSQALAQYTAQQKAIYDAGYAAGFEAGKKLRLVTPGGPGTGTTTVPVLSAPRVPGTVTYTEAPYYFLVEQEKGLGALEFSKNAKSGDITIRDVDPDSFAKLLANGKLAAPTQADKDLAMKDYFGLYQQQLKSLGGTQLPVAVVPK